MKTRAWSFIVLLIWASSTHAFDGKRKGLVLGGGAGFAPTAFLSRSTAHVRNSSTGIGYEIFGGKGMSERDMVLLEMRAVVRKAEEVHNLFLQHGFLGVSWRRYWVASVHSVFSSIGLGRVAISSFDNRLSHPKDLAFDNIANSSGAGWGYRLGLGYQFGKHAGLSFNYTAGGMDADDGSHVATHWLDISATLMLF